MLVAFTSSLMLAAQAHAEEAAPPLIDIDGTVYVQFALFLILFVVLSKVLFKPFLQIHDQRQHGMGGARHEAEELTTRAKQMTTDYDAKLLATKKSAADERQKLRAEAAKREQETLAEARAKASAAQTAARREIAQQTAAAQPKLVADAALLAKVVAKRILGREVA